MYTPDASAAAQRPTMGWSSWNTYRVNISDSLIRKQAFAMTQNGLKEAGTNISTLTTAPLTAASPTAGCMPTPQDFRKDSSPWSTISTASA